MLTEKGIAQAGADKKAIKISMIVEIRIKTFTQSLHIQNKEP
jgi:hypothetical protein